MVTPPYASSNQDGDGIAMLELILTLAFLLTAISTVPTVLLHHFTTYRSMPKSLI